MIAVLSRVKRVHFVGIGGIGMSGIAELLLNLGFEVSGSDLVLTDITKKLSDVGARITEGHDSGNVGSASVVVHSSAVRRGNPEVVWAEEHNIPVISRAEMLSHLVRMKPHSIAVAGTHGKTTTASLTGEVLTACGLDPTIIVGGVVRNLATNAVLGSGDYIVTEADEYDRSFLKLWPTVAVITAIEAEHLDTYANLDDIKEAFAAFASAVPFYGVVVGCGDEPAVRDVLEALNVPTVTYGLTESVDVKGIDFSSRGQETTYTLVREDDSLGRISLHLPGEHNVKNSLAAAAVGLELDLPMAGIRRGIADFMGVRRRFEIRKRVGDIMIVDDYAHHPTEVKSTLSAARAGWDRRIIAVFQPHLYSRTRDFAEEFGRSFAHADMVVVTDVYPARENPLPGVTGELISDSVSASGHPSVHYVASADDVADFLAAVIEPNDMVITIGAGDIRKVGDKLIQLLTELEVSSESA